MKLHLAKCPGIVGMGNDTWIRRYGEKTSFALLCKALKAPRRYTLGPANVQAAKYPSMAR